MRTLPAPALALAIALLPSALRAQAPDKGDTAIARAELEQGYELRTAGKCDEALPHLTRSFQLYPQLKTLLNRADCEERLGKLASARDHWTQARDRADIEKNDSALQEASTRFAALDKRVPRLVLKLAAGAPSGSEVTVDGAPVAAAALGTPLRVDPGRHVVAARASGYAEHSTAVTLAEGAQQSIEIAPDAAPSGAAPAPQAPAPAEPGAPQGETSGGGRTMRTVGIILGGAGIVSLAVGAVFGVTAITKQNSANCPNNVCGAGGNPSELRDAVAAGNASTVFVVGGAVLAAAGVTLFLVAPKPSPGPSAALFVGPAAAGFRGAF